MAPTPTAVQEPVKKKKSISHKLSKALGLRARTPKGNNAVPASEANNRTMPTDELEIERKFSEAVESMALPKAASDRMRTLPLAQKWQIIQDWTAKQNSKSSSERTQPLFWVHKLHDACDDASALSTEDARQLHVLMRGSDKEWLTAFHKEEGVLALTEWMAVVASDNQTALLQEATRCLKCLMNNKLGVPIVVGMPLTLPSSCGMQMLLQEPDAIDVLALCLDFEDESRRGVTLMILEMLSLVCWFSETGHSAVLAAMEKFRRVHQDRMRYASIVDCLKDGESVELQAACLMFINTLVSTSAALEDRVAVRNDFLALDVLVECHAIQDMVEALGETRHVAAYGEWGRGDAEQAAAKSFFKQVDVFEGLMHSDMEETIANDVDLANVDAVVAKLTRETKAHGMMDRLLHVLLALLVIPGEVSVGEKMWDLVEDAVIQITSLQTYRDLASKRVEYAAVRTAQRTRDEAEQAKRRVAQLEADVAQLTGKLSVLQTQPLSPAQESALAKLQEHHDLQQQLQAAVAKNAALEEQVATLQQDLQVAKSVRLASVVQDPPTIVAAAVVAGVGAADPALDKYKKLIKMGMPRDQVALKMKADGLDISLLDSSSTAPNVAAVDPAYEKYFKLLKMGMPLEQVQLKAKADGLDPAKLAAAPPANTPPPATTVNPAYEKFFKLVKMGMPLEQVKLKAQAEGLDPRVLDGQGAMTAAVAAPVSLLAAPASKPKPQPVSAAIPVSKLPPKKSAVPASKLRCLYWTPLSDASVEGSIWAKMDDAAKLGLDLSGLDKEFSHEAAPKKATEVAAIKPKVIHLVDPKRQQNCSIALSRFRMTPKDIKQAIVKLDDAVLTMERVQILETMVPTSDELDLVKGYDGDVTLLGETEKFFLALVDVPRLAPRLKAVTTMNTYLPRHDEIRGKVKVLEKALAELRQSTHVVALLEVVLAVGNYLNGGTARGGIWGFKLDVLPKLTQVKATSTAKSLLHCIADLVATKAPHAATFYDGLKAIDDAASISLGQVHNDLQGLDAALGSIHQEMGLQRDSSFPAKMQPFLTAAQADVAALKHSVARLQQQFYAVARSFGVDASKPAADGGDMAQWFFGLWADFCKAYKQAVAENDARRRDALKADGGSKRALSQSSHEPEDGDLFNQFSESLEGDASDIVAKFRKRHQGPKPNVPATAAVQNELAMKLAMRRRESTQVVRKK
ncbi:Aste57867_275 [Aphanomyces stellatus]|uniref:Aste57867_275 protein n=1 Tax=Aphanomyces stellatus TaxID=120398 RepID=A0A485K389_9STRA|nr:hypothetical protein As57867_000275 [Aphanomyces stellatus]VFT77501.1 Aste57867_275 [Aphanomyces stellatus]